MWRAEVADGGLTGMFNLARTKDLAVGLLGQVRAMRAEPIADLMKSGVLERPSISPQS
jgi:hypothetical protein